ncbi:MAG: energy transducer TonB [Burkholderiales bacterium]|uniref:energy transducer TonB n=1 Tax=Roseateles sp. TaxID=1971397 RepID=UPI000F99D259|nr:MAG: energy transducer TonB [Burkholderiales bacterium]
MRVGLLLSVAALHGALLAWCWVSRWPEAPQAGRRELAVRLVPATATTRVAATPALAALRSVPPLPHAPAVMAIAPPEFEVLAERRGAPEVEPQAAPAQPPVLAAAGAARDDAPASAAPLQAARRAACAPAPHPPALRERGIEGVVRLRVWVDELGRAGQVLLAASSGWRLFDEAAITQARGCPFHPALRGQQPIGSWVEFPVRFALEGSSNG